MKKHHRPRGPSQPQAPIDPFDFEAALDPAALVRFARKALSAPKPSAPKAPAPARPLASAPYRAPKTSSLSAHYLWTDGRSHPEPERLGPDRQSREPIREMAERLTRANLLAERQRLGALAREKFLTRILLSSTALEE